MAMETALTVPTLTALGSAVLSALLSGSKIHHKTWCCSHGPIVRFENSIDRRNFSIASSTFTANTLTKAVPHPWFQLKYLYL